LMFADSGELTVLGIDVASAPHQVQARVGYMPQRFGLYEDLSVRENLDLYADLRGIGADERRERYPRLMEMTALGPFVHRLAGRLSGGMKQKLGLACTLIRPPKLLLLDEPTVGVDPLSRRELWTILLQLVSDEGLTVLLSTAYLDEAERCGQVVVLHEGKLLAHGHPDEVSRLAAGRVFIAKPSEGQPPRMVQTRLLDHPEVVDAVPEGGRVRLVMAAAKAGGLVLGGASVTPTRPRFEDGFMLLLHRVVPARPKVAMTLDRPSENYGGTTMVEVHNLVRRFGVFTAVDHVTLGFRQARSSVSSGRMGPAKRRPSACCAVCFQPHRARSA
jgi:ABC-2 type transport system ATP-binding protein